METLSPFHQFVFQLLIGLKGGQPLPALIPELLNSSENEFYREIRVWWLLHQNRQSYNCELSTNNRRVLVEILEQGLAGLSVIAHLEELYEELKIEQEQQMQAYLERLPFKLLLPLLFCFFPAFLLLLFGPIVNYIYMEALK